MYLPQLQQYFNQRKARLRSELSHREGVKTSKRLARLYSKRDAKLDWFLHNISSDIVGHAVSHNINTIVIGYNKGWKQGINLGKRTNQKFVSLPFLKLIKFIEYKAESVGIRVVLTEESNTSKVSFLDREDLCKQESYVGRRVERGLFRTQGGTVINADVNGAANILRKVVPVDRVYGQGIEDGAVHPVTVHL